MNRPSSSEPDKSLYWLTLIPVGMFGLLGALIGAFNGDVFNGFLWGVGIGVALTVAIYAGMSGWDWIVARMGEGRLSAYLLVGFLVAVGIAGYFAIDMGSATCIDRDTEPRGGCYEYADDGFEPTTTQRWEKFWSTLPVTAIITCLIAALVHSKTHDKKKE